MINAQDGEFDTTTNDTEANQDSYEHDTESTTEDTEAPDTAPEADETVSVSRSELEKLRRESAAAKRLREKASKESSSKGSDKSDSPYDQELIERTFLAAQAGINDPDVQDEAIRLARKFDMNITQAIKDDDIKTRLANLQKQMTAKRAVAKDSAGSSAQNKGVDYWVQKFQKDGSLPPESKLAAQVLDKLAG